MFSSRGEVSGDPCFGQVPNFRLLFIQYLMAAFLVITRYYMLLPFFVGSLLCFLS